MKCPYPACSTTLQQGKVDVCGCESQNPLRACGQCGMVCRADARFCRACRSEFPLFRIAAARQLQVHGPDYLFLPGSFHTPPVSHGSFLWALSDEGMVYRLSPRSEAKPVLWARIPSLRAGLNRYTAVRVSVPEAIVRGPALLALEREGIYAVSLAQPQTLSALAAPGSGSILSNDSIEESPCFRGIAANESFFCYLYRAAESGAIRLAVRYFQRNRAHEEPVTLQGQNALTPVVCDDSVAVCGETELVLYTTTDQSKRSFSLPAAFVPFFQRPARAVNVPVTQTPLAVQKLPSGWQAWIGGQWQGKPGMLEVNLDNGNYEFHAAAESACLCAVSACVFAINQVASAEFYGIARPEGRFGALKPSMPLAVDEGRFFFFRSSTARKSHEVAVFGLGRDPLTLSFDDNYCDEDSCCGIFALGPELLVSYFQVPSAATQPRGLKFAHWSVQ